MREDDSYRTLLTSATDEYIVNKSRFLCHAAPCETEEDALRFLAEKRACYRDATHNCYAYVIGANAGIIRYSDDGEPSGTAGLPMMEVIRARGVVNCCVVVTRYFGGILLGAGGLVRAYSHSCSLALDKSGVGLMESSARGLLLAPYPLWDKVQYTLKKLPVIIEETVFDTDVQVTLLARTRDMDDIEKTINNQTNAKAETMWLERLYAPWPTE